MIKHFTDVERKVTYAHVHQKEVCACAPEGGMRMCTRRRKYETTKKNEITNVRLTKTQKCDGENIKLSCSFLRVFIIVPSQFVFEISRFCYRKAFVFQFLHFSFFVFVLSDFVFVLSWFRLRTFMISSSYFYDFVFTLLLTIIGDDPIGSPYIK